MNYTDRIRHNENTDITTPFDVLDDISDGGSFVLEQDNEYFPDVILAYRDAVCESGEWTEACGELNEFVIKRYGME